MSRNIIVVLSDNDTYSGIEGAKILDLTDEGLEEIEGGGSLKNLEAKHIRSETDVETIYLERRHRR